MACNREQEYLLYLWGEMEEDQLKSFTLHLHHCPACKEQIERLGPVVGSMRSVEVQELPEAVAGRIRPRLTSIIEPRPRALRFSAQKMLAVAASITFFAGVGLIWQNAANNPADPRTLRREQTQLILSDDDYVEALALVLIDEPTDPGDILTQAIEDVGYEIELLSQEIQDQSEPMAPSKDGPADQGSNPTATNVKST